MLFKPELNNQDDVLKWYEARENPCYVLCTGVKLDAKQIISKWTNEDNISGKDKLYEALDFITKNPSNTNVYTLVSFPYHEGIENEKLKDLEGETIRFQFHTSGYSTTTLGNVAQNVISDSKSDYAKELLLMMRQQNEALLQRIEAIERKRQLEIEMETEEDDDDDDQPKTISGKERLLGALAGIVERPEFTETIFGVVGMVLNKFMSAPEPPKNPNL